MGVPSTVEHPSQCPPLYQVARASACLTRIMIDMYAFETYLFCATSSPEAAMMAIVSQPTDKPDWHRKVFDEEIVASEREDGGTGHSRRRLGPGCSCAE